MSMGLVFFWALIFAVSTSVSIALLGDRNLISGNLFKLKNFFNLVFHWKFIVSMFLALGARASFIMINNTLLSIPRLAQNSTTITAFITAISFVFIIIVNAIMLHERISFSQGAGAFCIMLGIWLMLK